MKPEKPGVWKVGIVPHKNRTSPHEDRTDGGKSISWEVVAICTIVLVSAVNALWIVTAS